MKRSNALKLGIAAFLALLVLGGAVYWWLGDDIAVFMNYAVSEGTHPGLFLLMFAVLPPLGFPISAFLVLIGAKFGAWAGVLIMAAGMPIHLLVAFFVAHTFLRSLVQRYLEKIDYRLPEVPKNRILSFSFFFMAVPGLSYTLKNYVLALSGVPFKYFFLSGYLLQAAMGIPFVIAGEALAGKSLLLLAAVLVVLLVIYFVVHKIRKRRTWNTS
ncbi:MAG: VTT domain-containing protein [Desulfobacterales bacterium]|nr:VTT domain-containing protein [Desulfobacterales bacterium]